MYLRFITILMSLVSFSAFIYFGYADKSVQMGQAFAMVFLTLAFLNLDKFKSIKGPGIEAQLQETVKEAYVKQAKLQELLSKMKEEEEKLSALSSQTAKTRDELNLLQSTLKEKEIEIEKKIKRAQIMGMCG